MIQNFETIYKIELEKIAKSSLIKEKNQEKITFTSRNDFYSRRTVISKEKQNENNK